MKGKLAMVVLLAMCLGAFGAVAQLTAKNKSPKSIAIMTTVVSVPAKAAPTGACAGAFVHCVTLTWNAPTANTDGSPITGTLSYSVYRATSVSGVIGAFSQVGTSASVSYEDDTVVSGTTYVYQVTATETIAGRLRRLPRLPPIPLRCWFR